MGGFFHQSCLHLFLSFFFKEFIDFRIQSPIPREIFLLQILPVPVLIKARHIASLSLPVLTAVRFLKVLWKLYNSGLNF